MSTVKPTPGPWELDMQEGKITANGEYVTYVCLSRYVDQRPDPEALANARLIATAPELLEALQNAAHRVRWLMQFVDDEEPIREELRDWDAAIARATGMQP